MKSRPRALQPGSFLLATTQVLPIRNISYKLFPQNQLLATEVSKYDSRVILEALHNCIAHQDYQLRLASSSLNASID